MKIVDTFEIIGRGLVVATDEITSLPVATELLATITRPDGATFAAAAYKEWLFWRQPVARESEAFLLRGLSKPEVPIDSEIEITTLC
ncbi:hypothetical protein [Caulobacter sp. LARHSG274]